MYTGTEKLLYVEKDIVEHRLRYLITYAKDDKPGSELNSITVALPIGKFDRNTIIESLVRSKFSQHQVESIINNRLLDVCEYFDILKKDGSTKANSHAKAASVDKDYYDLQAWRKTCKEWADKILKEYK